MEKEDTGHNRSWLQRVAEQSWEPELLISGLAIYATIQIPQFVMDFYQYYRYNLQLDTGFIDELMPMLVVGVMLTALKVLNFAFIFHFIVRAFWVGLVGLRSVFSDGIQYDKLEYSEFYRSEMKKRLGNQDSFLLATDRLASVIFSIAFLFVLYMFGVGFLYAVFFLLMNGVKLLVSEEIFDLYSTVILISTAVLLIGVSIVSLVLNTKKYREQEKFARYHFNLTWYASLVFYPFIYKPIQFLILSFASNLPKKKNQIYGMIFFALFMAIFMSSTFELMNVNLVEARDFYSSRSSESTLVAENYESEFDGKFFEKASISSPYLKKGEYFSLFIPYNKMLDRKLGKYCDEAAPADSLNRYERRKLTNQQNIECANQFFSVTINREDTLESDFLFYNHHRTGQAGFRSTYMLSDTLNSGRYELGVYRPVIDKADTERDSLDRLLSYEVEIPFWIQ
ncbi:MAG: hypothetical protein JJ971_07720 [Balneolaceae bacterium]|nr:hypothetical protein [Balneolaceae bacterium]MBO6546877.1 hypothetical protein [Balneolaceae bacterium]MBO6649237.1 hypothetical protein [Balneolaceae bacterium]